MKNVELQIEGLTIEISHAVFSGKKIIKVNVIEKKENGYFIYYYIYYNDSYQYMP